MHIRSDVVREPLEFKDYKETLTLDLFSFLLLIGIYAMDWQSMKLEQF